MNSAAAVQPISADDAKEMLDRGEAVAVDVRELMELAATGKIPGALTIPYSALATANDADLTAALTDIPLDRTVILYCASGKRSEVAGQMLVGLGYEKVFNLGGLKDWIEAGLPVEEAGLD